MHIACVLYKCHLAVHIQIQASAVSVYRDLSASLSGYLKCQVSKVTFKFIKFIHSRSYS